MDESREDFRELLLELNGHRVEYLVVGGHAVMFHTEPRYTKDMDLWVHNSPDNSPRVYRALAAFGAPLAKDRLTPESFTEHDLVYQIGVVPTRIDVMTRIPGLDFSSAWANRVSGTLFGVPVHFLSLDDLMVAKQAAGRKSDLGQLRSLKRKRPKGR